ncbi:hypothetical protein KOY_05423 [Bacillus cereus VDM021]|uniref:hypothetical protein n=1 Tax=Bacillus cereus group sp. BfR-BA-01315 TaxID=2920292 RepID=UPI000330131F|nr:hypothetical protein [Bacillus cereus group sp. BfR-BA-01315]EOQ01026.1 hypothetical protein KOY_05423 [Bacillus cereus VDM021]
MKDILRFLLLLCLLFVLTSCKNENSSNIILSVGKPIENAEIQFKNTDDDKKIRIINGVFNEKKWDVNKDFDVRGKEPDLVLEINDSNEGMPALSVTVYFNENGADVINFKAEHTVLNKVESDKLKEVASI